jgi:hypothetical protein
MCFPIHRTILRCITEAVKTHSSNSQRLHQSLTIEDWNWVKFYLGFEVLTAVAMKSSIFCDITSCSQLKVNWHFGKLPPPSSEIACCLDHTGFFLSLLSTLKMVGTCSSKTSVYVQRITRLYIAGDRTLWSVIYLRTCNTRSTAIQRQLKNEMQDPCTKVIINLWRGLGTEIEILLIPGSID